MRTWSLIAGLALSLQCGVAEEVCLKESLQFANCIDESINNLGPTASSPNELSQQVQKKCADDQKAYADCGGIDKGSYAEEFIKSRVELFHKEKPRMTVDRKTIDRIIE